MAITTQAGPQPPKEDRDPNKLNKHITVNFTQVFGEPENNHSISCIWEFSEVFYSCFSGLCYGLCSCLFGWIIVMYWGCVFAYTAFVHIWACSPFRFLLDLLTQIVSRPLRPIINCCIRPWTGAFAHFFILFAEPGVDIDKWNYPQIKAPVRKIKIVQDSPVPVKRTTEEKQAKPKPKPKEEDMYLGDKEKMARSVQRQMMLI